MRSCPRLDVKWLPKPAIPSSAASISRLGNLREICYTTVSIIYFSSATEFGYSQLNIRILTSLSSPTPRLTALNPRHDRCERQALHRELGEDLRPHVPRESRRRRDSDRHHRRESRKSKISFLLDEMRYFSAYRALRCVIRRLAEKNVRCCVQSVQDLHRWLAVRSTEGFQDRRLTLGSTDQRIPLEVLHHAVPTVGLWLGVVGCVSMYTCMGRRRRLAQYQRASTYQDLSDVVELGR